MAKNNQDELARAYAMLSSLRKNIEKMTSRVAETYVRELHTVLDKLEGVGINVTQYRIPDSEITRTPGAVNNVSGKTTSYSKEKYVDKPFILTQLDAILGYFEIITSEKPRKIGFSK